MKRLILFLSLFLTLNTETTFASALWETLPSFTQRRYHKTISLDANKILSIGGETTSPVSWVEQLTYQSNNWMWLLREEIPIGRSFHTLSRLSDNNILVVGGTGTSGGVQNTTRKYNISTNSWEDAGIIQSKRSHHAATTMQENLILISGGFHTSFTATNSAEVLNASSIPITSTIISPLPKILIDHTATAVEINNKKFILVAGGSNLTTISKNTYLYDIGNNSWSSGPDMNTPRANHTAIKLNDGRVMFIGSAFTTDIWDPNTNIISPLNTTPQMTYFRRYHTAELLKDGRVMVAGGYGSQLGIPGNNILNSVEIYDPTTNTWTIDTPMTYPRMDHASTILDDGRVVVSGGASTTGNTGTVEIYTPEEIITPTLTPTPTPSDTPSPTPTPTPNGPQPFLDLPWDYALRTPNFSFTEAALSMKSIFDHEYPLISIGSSYEPASAISKITGYNNIEYPYYTSHDGYDWGRKANTKNGTPVLAAAAGTATFHNSCTPCGNQIRINHRNGYQTRYYHLQTTDLITNNTSESIEVTKGQQIGLVGYTGNVLPKNEDGSHIHFMVIEDKDNDGNFNDNIPDGLTDPFGWQSTSPDPWENYTFSYLNQNLTGNKSYYLWNKRIENLNSTLSSNGGVFSTGKLQLEVPQNAVAENVNLKITPHPITQIPDNYESLIPIMEITAHTATGTLLTTFPQPLKLIFDLSGLNLNLYNPNTLNIFSSSDGINWTTELTSVNGNTATTNVSHLTYFALMAQRNDTIAPTTTAQLSGDKGTGNNFRSNVELTLNAEDNENGLGIDHTLYRTTPDSDWIEYTSPVIFSDEGNHKIEFFSSDIDDNIEEIKTLEFTVNKSIPEIEITFDLLTSDLLFTGIDGEDETNITQTELYKNNYQVSATDIYGNNIILTLIKKLSGQNIIFNILNITYNNNEAHILPSNRIHINYSKNQNSLTHLLQTLSIDSHTSLLLNYHISSGLTSIIEDSTPQALFPGMKLLRLYTEDGELKYSY